MRLIAAVLLLTGVCLHAEEPKAVSELTALKIENLALQRELVKAKTDAIHAVAEAKGQAAAGQIEDLISTRIGEACAEAGIAKDECAKYNYDQAKRALVHVPPPQEGAKSPVQAQPLTPTPAPAPTEPKPETK